MDSYESTTSSVTALADFAARLRIEDLPADIIEMAKACVLYALAVGVATKNAKPALLAAAASEGGTETATRLLNGSMTSPGSAAFANGVLLSGRAQGDSHPCGHLGGVIIPAALAAAEQHKVTGATLITAIAAGYEVALRIGRDHFSDLSLRGFRTTPCYGIFGAAVAAGKIKGFNAQQIATAICLAPNFCGGLREYVAAGTEESPLHAGFSARNGLYVTDLVACGAEAAPSALTGSAGFYRAFGKKDVDYARRLNVGLGSDFEFKNVTYKDNPVCQKFRGLIRGLAILRKQAKAGIAVERIELRMTPYEAEFIGSGFKGPYSGAAQTLMSAPFCAALAWLTGTVSYNGLRDLKNENTLALVQKVDLISDASQKKYKPHIEVSFSDGSNLSWDDTSGDANYRLGWDAAVGMSEALCEEVNVPENIAADLIKEVAAVENLPDVNSIISKVCAATKS